VIRRILPALLLLALSAGVAGATSPDGLFDQGNGAYEAGRYEEAAEAYTRVLAYGVRDPRAHYNLANAYFKLGRIGPAILHYERALRLAPGDEDIRDNLEFARTRIRDRVEAPPMPYPIAAMRRILDTLPAGLVAGLLLGFYWAGAGALGTLWIVRRPEIRRALGYMALAAGVVTLVAAGALLWKTMIFEADHAIVMRDRADVLSGPAEDNTVLFTVHEGTRLEVRNRRGGWIQVSLPNALSGWIASANVEPV
jgi:tetratricopeptide (TPR) repeat protein